MENKSNLDSPIKYMQGSVWKWKNNNGYKAGVQAGERPVMIVSNNTFNTFSPVVNCVTITSQLKDSPVHVPIYIFTESHVQCEQIHTVNKTELIDFIGNAPNSTLSSVKAKLRIQFDMSADRNTELFNNIKKSIDALNINPEIMSSIKETLELLNEKADKGFGLQEIESDFLKLVLNIENSIEQILTEVRDLKSADKLKTKEDAIGLQTEKPDVVPESKENGKRNKRREYTYEDKVFIADKHNSLDALMEKYNYDRTRASKMRTYFRRQLRESSGTEASPEIENTPPEDKRTYRKYTDEDKRFILDTQNSIEDIIKRYDFKDKKAVYYARASFKKSKKIKIAYI